MKIKIIHITALALCLAGCASPEVSTTAPPVGNQSELQRLDLSKYDVVTVMAFDVQPGSGVDPIVGQKFAGDVFGRLKHDFGNLFTEVRFGEPEGKANELVVTGNLRAYANADQVGIILQRVSKVDGDLILRDAATKQVIFSGDIKMHMFEGTVESMQLAGAASVANTVARGRGWQPAK